MGTLPAFVFSLFAVIAGIIIITTCKFSVLLLLFVLALWALAGYNIYLFVKHTKIN